MPQGTAWGTCGDPSSTKLSSIAHQGHSFLGTGYSVCGVQLAPQKSIKRRSIASKQARVSQLGLGVFHALVASNFESLHPYEEPPLQHYIYSSTYIHAAAFGPHQAANQQRNESQDKMASEYQDAVALRTLTQGMNLPLNPLIT